MTTGTWSTQELAQSDAADAWSAKLAELHMGWAMTFPEPEQFSASMRYRTLETMTVAEFQTGRCAGAMPKALSTDEPVIGILMNLSGRLQCRYTIGDEFTVDTGEVVVWDSETASGFEAVDPHHELYLLVPRQHAPAGLIRSARRAAGAVSARPGTGLFSVAADQMTAINRELDNLSDTGLATACQALIDTMNTAVSLPSRPVRESLLVRVRRYIEDNLDDPDLSPSDVASANNISLRTLQLAFAESGTTASHWIRDRRLKTCYRALAHARASETVTDIAFRWGFKDVGHFSRTFKYAYGVSPSHVLAAARGVRPNGASPQ
jgi:AraC-like DNA-binding protein